jgi:ABC-type bacteriocin/lantibiotic exporter with double-glycine peptidase domain
MLNLFYVFNILECGHFCLKYILKKDGIKLDVEYDKKMMSMGLIKRVLEEYYLVECYQCSNLFFLPNRRFLTLIKVRGKYFHYVVVEKIENKQVFYYDPAFIGLRKIKKERFLKIWANYCCFYSKK